VDFWESVNELIARNPRFTDCAFNKAFKFIKLNLSDPPKDKINIYINNNKDRKDKK
jgi:hypothetical protein